MEVHDLRFNRVIARVRGPELDFPERLSMVEIKLPVNPLPLQHPGNYDIVVFADGQEIDRMQFTAYVPESE